MKFKFAGITTVSLALMLGATGCSSPNVETGPVGEVETSVSATPTVTPVESNEVIFAAPSLGLQGEQAIEDGKLQVGDHTEIIVNASGTLEAEPTNNKPAAEGEVLHAFHLSPTVDDSLEDASINVDGKTIKSKLDLVSSSTLIVSAKADSKITLKATVNGVTQELDLRTGERLTMGIADAWYLNGEGTVTGQDHIVPFKLNSEFSGNVETSFKTASKSPLNSEEGWADKGKSAWLTIEGTKPAWEFKKNGSATNKKQIISVKDSKGKSYKPTNILTPSGFDTDQTIIFKVPAAETKFTIHSEASADISKTDKKRGTISGLKSSSKVSFE